jgi:hypothetical protein
MVTGRLPFEGTSARDILRSEYAGLSTMPSTIRPELNVAVDNVFQKALSFNSSDRYRKARDLGDALYVALTRSGNRVSVREAPRGAKRDPVPEVASRKAPIDLKPLVNTQPQVVEHEPSQPPAAADEPAWTRRSPEPPEVGSSRKKLFAAIGIPLLLVLLAAGWYYVVKHPVEPDMPTQVSSGLQPSEVPSSSAPAAETEMPPLPRSIPQPPNTNYYQNSKQNLKGDLLRNFVAFSLYYPKDWKVNGPQESSTSGTRGKFLDIARITPDGRLREQMLVSYYPSKGTFKEDAAKFPDMVKEANETLKKILPGYQMVSDGEIKLNGDWRAYEMKFQGGGTSPSGEKIVVWGRRLFIPASRPGVRNGFEITMIATSAAEDVRSVDDVGVRGELAPILYSFEPSQNF